MPEFDFSVLKKKRVKFLVKLLEFRNFYTKMNIYFSCSITGGRNDQPVYAAIVQALLEDGHHVPTAILASPQVMDMEMVVDPREVYRRDVDWVQACDALIAEVSTPSHGVGYEIALALMLEKPVLACFRAGVPVSKMILGNDHPRFTSVMYRDAEEAVILIRDFLRGL
ncbi:MAG: deoxyribonucleoside 5'-monophosphate N-glycosidase [Bellilinea sp.]|nr:MAG: deoxyribonucleoside 5'-monophosphate N-glycosidase [Bellilinea sp.]